MKAKRLTSLVLALALVFSFGIFRIQPAEAADAPVMGNVVKYDPNIPVNNGEDINIEFWYWTGAANLFQALAEQYMAVHPNVHITLVENPWDDYWTKLPLALQGNDGPAIFNVHNGQHDNFLQALLVYNKVIVFYHIIYIIYIMVILQNILSGSI